MSQITNFIKSSGPGSGTVTSISQGTGITLTPNPITTTGTVALTIPVAIANGGTNATSFTNTDGVVYFDGTRLVDTTAGTAGQVLTSNGAGVAPTFQAAAAGGAVTTLHTQDGNNVTPTVGVINISGGNSLTTTGTAGPNTATISLTGITQYNVQTGGASNALNNVAPSATSGVPLISQGAAAQPIFGTAVVAGGGTGSVSFNVSGVVISGAAPTSALTSVTLTDGQVVIGNSAGAPAAATLTAGTGISVTNGHNSITIAATGTTQLTVTSVNHAASPYTVLTTDDYLAVDCSAGVVTLKLPNAPTTGRVWHIKDSTGNAATSNITITTVGGVVNIDGATSFVMNTNFESTSVIFTGSQYEVF